MKLDPAAEFGLELKFGVFVWQVIKTQIVGPFFSRIRNGTHGSRIKKLCFYLKKNTDKERWKDQRFPAFVCFVQVAETLNIMATQQ